MARKNAIISTTIADDASRVSFTVAGFDPIHVVTANLSADLIAYAAAHGIKQKIGDAGALGKDASDSDKYNAMRAVADRLIAGDWDKARGDGTGSAVAGLIFRAFSEWAGDMARATGSDTPTDAMLRASYDAMDRKAQLGLRNVPAIAVIMDRMRAEKAPKSSPVSAADLLAKLGIAPKGT